MSAEHDETPVEDSGMPPRGYVPFDEQVVGYRAPRPRRAWILPAIALVVGIVCAAGVAYGVLALFLADWP